MNKPSGLTIARWILTVAGFIAAVAGVALVVFAGIELVTTQVAYSGPRITIVIGLLLSGGGMYAIYQAWGSARDTTPPKE